MPIFYARVFQQEGQSLDEVAEETRNALIDRVGSDVELPARFSNLPTMLAEASSMVTADTHHVLAFVMDGAMQFESEYMERAMRQLPRGIVVLLVVCGEVTKLKRDWLYYFGEAGPNAERLAIIYPADETGLAEAIHVAVDELAPEA